MNLPNDRSGILAEALRLADQYRDVEYLARLARELDAAVARRSYGRREAKLLREIKILIRAWTKGREPTPAEIEYVIGNRRP